jgi:hypothetical protein
MILPENLDRCNKIVHAGTQNYQKLSVEVNKIPAGDRKVPRGAFMPLVFLPEKFLQSVAQAFQPVPRKRVNRA